MKPLAWLNLFRVRLDVFLRRAPFGHGTRRRVSLSRAASVSILAALLTGLIQPALMAQAQTEIPPAVLSLYNQMTPEERIGQLFLVTFTGRDITPESDIYDLIVNYHVGGVVLLNGNDNFAPVPDTVLQTYQLINSLQRIEWDGAVSHRSAYVPLFVGIAQEGNGYPTDQLLQGLTPLPSEMAIGATWDADLAEQVGETLGRELSTLGFNLYFGPSLDVLESPSTRAGGDLGTRVFGGDPYWVGIMGRAYISGLHAGSQNRMIVIAKHFPGRGGTDRLPEEEVATVRKSLEQLKQIELAPFFAVTGSAPSPDATVDGLLVSHIRYQGFQGNIRATTRPVSFDAQALTDILSLQQFSGWRQNGGLTVSDDLGSLAVRGFYSPGGQTFSGRVVARDAFLAGNDLLYLGGIVSSDAPDNHDTVLRILDFFAQKYREDPAFAERVDAAVLRILTRKYDLYEGFSFLQTTPLFENLQQVGNAQEITFSVARRAATLISPDPQEFATLLATPPQGRDRLVFITDNISVKQCPSCGERPILEIDALQKVVLRLYGPQGGSQTSEDRLNSYSFKNLQDLLDGLDASFLESDLSRADWVILSLTDASRGQPQLVSRFLSERQDLLRGKQVILFSFGAPYYLDATDISKLAAYFGLYSKQPPFVDVAARLLYQELTPSGASPVSIPGVGYDLIEAMTPNPNQIIPLSLDLPAETASTMTPATPEATAIPLFRIGDTIAIRTGTILDHNAHPVPDGTVVRFSMMLTGEGGGILQQVDAVTSSGIARASFGLDKPGLLEIRAASEPAAISEVLQLDVSSNGPVAVTLVVPVLSQTVIPTAKEQSPDTSGGFISAEGYPRFGAWLVMVVLLAGASGLGYWSGVKLYGPHSGIRWALGIAVGGLAAYTYLALGLIGAATWTASNGMSGVIVLILIGTLLGWAFGWWWSRRI